MAYDQFRGRFIAPQTCAEELEVSEVTVHRWISNGLIKATKLSCRCTRILGDSVADFLESRTFSAGSKQEQRASLKAVSAERGNLAKTTGIDLAGQA